MDLTEAKKRYINSLGYDELLRHLWESPIGESPWLLGDTGDYWMRRWKELRAMTGKDCPHLVWIRVDDIILKCTDCGLTRAGDGTEQNK